MITWQLMLAGSKRYVSLAFSGLEHRVSAALPLSPSWVPMKQLSTRGSWSFKIYWIAGKESRITHSISPGLSSWSVVVFVVGFSNREKELPSHLKLKSCLIGSVRPLFPEVPFNGDAPPPAGVYV